MKPDSTSSFSQATTRAYDLLDITNAKMLSAIAQVGPRNLTRVAKSCGLPVSTVHDRVRELEGVMRTAICRAQPCYSKLGLRRFLLIANPCTQGQNLSEFLKIPNYWTSVSSCEGPFASHSIHAVPDQYAGQFRELIDQLARLRTIRDYNLMEIGETYAFFPSLQHYDAKTRSWQFAWDHWVEETLCARPRQTTIDPMGYTRLADEQDITIIAKLELDGRMTFTDIAAELTPKVSPQAVKMRYDRRILGQGLISQYIPRVWLFPIQSTALREVHLNFFSKDTMNAFAGYVGTLPFTHSVTKVRSQDSLILRAMVPYEESDNFLEFLNALSRRGFIASFSSLRILMHNRQTQTISPEEFKNGDWQFAPARYLEKVQTLLRQPAGWPSLTKS